ncbi:MAG: DUF427 domain-containing protein [Pseudomonadota bacterium]
MDQITLVKDAIHRPDEPRHFMQFKYPDKHFVASYKGQTLAETSNALVLSEVGYGIYEPVIYFPVEDVKEEVLRKTAKSTHCPLKGDTEYFDLAGNGADEDADIAWRYAQPFDFAEKLIGYIAFDSRKVRIESDSK